MSERSTLIARLLKERDYRANYIRAKLDVLVPSQLRALRLRQDVTQPVLAEQAGMKQSRISAMEAPGRTNFNLETLVRMAATFRVGLVVKLVPFSEMLRWENEFGQDTFNVTKLDDDVDFLHPSARNTNARRRTKWQRNPRQPNTESIPQVPIAGARMSLTHMLSARQERAQMRLPFETPVPQTQAVNVITLQTRIGSVPNLPVLKMAAGAGGNYGI